MQLNVEGLSKAKADVLHRFLDDEKIDILAIQESHTQDRVQLMKRGTISGYSITGATCHSKYETATYVKNDLKWNHIKSSDDNNIFSIVTQVGNLFVNNIYKPSATDWPTPALITTNPAIYIGDFNSHHTCWGYRVTNTYGDKLVQWSEAKGIKLVHDAKQKGTFNSSARWNRAYNPDLCFISSESK